jgi:hypothetical protein
MKAKLSLATGFNRVTSGTKIRSAVSTAFLRRRLAAETAGRLSCASNTGLKAGAKERKKQENQSTSAHPFPS